MVGALRGCVGLRFWEDRSGDAHPTFRCDLASRAATSLPSRRPTGLPRTSSVAFFALCLCGPHTALDYASWVSTRRQRLCLVSVGRRDAFRRSSAPGPTSARKTSASTPPSAVRAGVRTPRGSSLQLRGADPRASRPHNCGVRIPAGSPFHDRPAIRLPLDAARTTHPKRSRPQGQIKPRGRLS